MGQFQMRNKTVHFQTIPVQQDKFVVLRRIVPLCVQLMIQYRHGNCGIFHDYGTLEQWEREQREQIGKENAMFQQTRVDFRSMDSGVEQ